MLLPCCAVLVLVVGILVFDMVHVGTGVGSVSKIWCQCLSCCVGDIWENSVGSGENGGGRVGGGLCSRFCGEGPSSL